MTSQPPHPVPPVPSPVPAVQKIPHMPMPNFTYDDEERLSIDESTTETAPPRTHYTAPATPESPPRHSINEPSFIRTVHGTPTLSKSSSFISISSDSPRINDLRAKTTPRKRSRSRSKSYDRDDSSFDNKYRRSESSSSLNRFRDDDSSRDVRQQSMDRSTR